MVYYNFIKPGQASYYPSILGSLDTIIFYSISDYINPEGEIPLVDVTAQSLINSIDFVRAQYLREGSFPDGTLFEAIDTTNGLAVHILLKQLKLKRYYDVTIKNAFSSLDTERETWERQKIEADAYTLDVNASTPFLDALSLSRGITKADTVAKILGKATTYAMAVGNILGEQYKSEDQLELCTTLVELDALVLPDFCTLEIDLVVPVIEPEPEPEA